MKALHSTMAGRVKHALYQASVRAKKAGLPFDLTPEWLQPKLEHGFCEVTGLPLDFEYGGKGQRANTFSPSLDRVDPMGGYTPENTKVTVWIYNRAKGPSRDEDVLLMARALTKGGYALKLWRKCRERLEGARA